MAVIREDDIDSCTSSEEEDDDIEMEAITPQAFKERVHALAPYLTTITKDPTRVERIIEFADRVTANLECIAKFQEEWQQQRVADPEDDSIMDLYGMHQDYLDTCGEMSEDLLHNLLECITNIRRIPAKKIKQ
jgi:hypothetical protein